MLLFFKGIVNTVIDIIMNTQNALKISFKGNYVKLYNLCNLLVHIYQSQSSDSLLIHSIALILKVFSQCTVYMTL